MIRSLLVSSAIIRCKGRCVAHCGNKSRTKHNNCLSLVNHQSLIEPEAANLMMSWKAFHDDYSIQKMSQEDMEDAFMYYNYDNTSVLLNILISYLSMHLVMLIYLHAFSTIPDEHIFTHGSKPKAALSLIKSISEGRIQYICSMFV